MPSFAGSRESRMARTRPAAGAARRRQADHAEHFEPTAALRQAASGDANRGLRRERTETGAAGSPRARPRRRNGASASRHWLLARAAILGQRRPPSRCTPLQASAMPLRGSRQSTETRRVRPRARMIPRSRRSTIVAAAIGDAQPAATQCLTTCPQIARWPERSPAFAPREARPAAFVPSALLGEQRGERRCCRPNHAAHEHESRRLRLPRGAWRRDVSARQTRASSSGVAPAVPPGHAVADDAVGAREHRETRRSWSRTPPCGDALATNAAVLVALARAASWKRLEARVSSTTSITAASSERHGVPAFEPERWRIAAGCSPHAKCRISCARRAAALR